MTARSDDDIKFRPPQFRCKRKEATRFDYNYNYNWIHNWYDMHLSEGGGFLSGNTVSSWDENKANNESVSGGGVLLVRIWRTVCCSFHPCWAERQKETSQQQQQQQQQQQHRHARTQPPPREAEFMQSWKKRLNLKRRKKGAAGRGAGHERTWFQNRIIVCSSCCGYIHLGDVFHSVAVELAWLETTCMQRA